MTEKRGIVSFCVFGPDRDDIYVPGAVKNVDLYLTHHPSILCRLYVGRTPWNRVSSLLSGYSNVELIKMDQPEDQTATYWRVLALRDPNYDFYLFRDVDSRPIERERVAVQEWLDSPYEFHVMRDHPRHGMPMLAGMWGMKSRYRWNVAKRLPDRLMDDYYLVDQDFLSRRVWPFARCSLMSHVDCKWNFKMPTWEFKVPWQREGFVGQGLYGDDRPRFPLHSRVLVG